MSMFQLCQKSVVLEGKHEKFMLVIFHLQKVTSIITEQNFLIY